MNDNNNMKRAIIHNGALSATEADTFEVVDGIVYALDPQTGKKERICRRDEIIPGSIVKEAYAAAVPRVATINFADSAIGDEYSFTIEQWTVDPTGVEGEVKKFLFSHVSTAADDDNIATAFAAQMVTAAADGLVPTGSAGTGTLTITGVSPNQIFKVTLKKVGAGAVLAYGTAGSERVNLGTDVNAKLDKSHPDAYLATTTDEYTTYEWNHRQLAGKSMQGEKFVEVSFLLAFDESGTNFAAVETAIDTELGL